MGDSASWARDQEREAQAKRDREEAEDIREQIVAQWSDWGLKRMEMVGIIADLEWGDEARMLKIMKEFDNLQTYFQMQRKIAKGDLL